MSQRIINMSLFFILLNFLSLTSLISARPTGELKKVTGWRSVRELLRITPRDSTIGFGEIGASFTLGGAESRLAPGGTYPRLTRLSDGGVLSVSSFSDGNGRVLRVARSDDNGANFNLIGEVARSNGDLDNGFLLQLPSGSILAAFRNHDRNADGSYSWFRITVCRSDDGGRTWAFLSQAAENPADASGFNGLWEPFIRIAKDGSIQLTYSGELSQSNQETFRVVSRDGGATWTAPTNLRLHGENQQFRDGMQGIASIRDANGRDALVMVFEVKDGPNFYLSTVTSYDDGNTWGSRNTIYRPAQHNAGAPQIATIGNGLAVVFMTDEDTPADQLQWANKADIKMIFSSELRDGQIKWTTQTMHLSEDSSYWPGMFQRGTNDIMAVYERGGVPLGRVVTRV